MKSVSEEEPAKEEVAQSGDGRKPTVTSGDDRKLPETSGARQRIEEIAVGPDISIPDSIPPDATPPDSPPPDSPPPDMSVPADLEIPDLDEEPKLGLLNNSDVKMSCAIINQGEASSASFGSLEDSAEDEEMTRGRAEDEEMTLHHVARGNSPSVVEVECTSEAGQQLGQQVRIFRERTMCNVANLNSDMD